MKRAIKLCAWALTLVLWTAPAAAQDGGSTLTGAWTISFSTSYGTVSLDTELTQDGTTLRGESGSALGYRTDFVEGKVEGDSLSFDIDVEVEGDWYPLSFKGTLENGEMSGRVDIPDGTRTAFTGRRKEGG